MSEQEKELSEQEVLQAMVSTFRAVTSDLAEKVEQIIQRAETYRAGLDQRRDELDRREAEIPKREQLVKAREDSLGSVRQLAADRKAQVEAAQDREEKSHELRKKAEGELRMCQQEKAKMEQAMAVLLKEKIELSAKLEARAIVEATIPAVKEG